MKKTIGILAHVDGGKTTFSEQLLYHAGASRTPGRVDSRDTVMDANPIERERGITIFADQGYFEYNQNTYYLLDTPGHVDFSAETERAVMALDYAVLLLDGTGGVPAHTVTLFKLLERYRVPVFFFINKMDLEGADAVRAMEAVRSRLTEDAVLIRSPGELGMEGALAEFVAEREDVYKRQILEYDQASSAEYRVKAGGEDWTYERLAQDLEPYSDQYYEIQNALDRERNKTVGEIYRQLVQVRREIAGECGYDNYADYAYQSVYGRDFTKEDVERIRADVKLSLIHI